jgi:transcription antitermination factor NusG
MMGALEWMLVYTKSRCEAWCEANLRNQGFEVLGPRVRTAKGIEALFARYLFVGHERGRDTRSVENTRGVQRIVTFGGRLARVPQDVIDEVRSRIGADGLVQLDVAVSPLFDRAAAARLRALVKLAEAGFRVRAA